MRCVGGGYVVLLALLSTVDGNRDSSSQATPNHNFTEQIRHNGQDCPGRSFRNDFSDESRLINCLLAKYARVSTLSRPVKDSSANVIVDFGVSLVQILDFDEIKQVLTTSMWKNYVWTDQVLQWQPELYGGVTHIRLPATHIWTPDIVLYNNADEQVKQHEELAAVYFNGTVKWIPPAIYRSSCEIDMKNFPFDEQTCYFKFGSWTYDQYKVDLKLFEDRKAIDLREYIQSSEWDVMNTTADRQVRRYQFFETDPYPELMFRITLKRQSTFYIYLLVLPCILLSSLTLVLFWIPPQRPDRTAVGMSLFSSFFILLLILVQSSPPTSASISRLGLNYCINMVLIAVSTILSVVIINIGQAGDTRAPWPSQECVVLVARLLCIRNSKYASYEIPASETADSGTYLECLNGNQSINSRVTDSIRRTGKRRRGASWNLIAAILDRCFFMIYLLIIVLSTIFIFPV